MDKWADYFISEVSYDSEHLINVALRHQETKQGITKGKPVDRLTITSDIKNGLIHITIYSGKNSWKKGHKIETFSIEGTPYLRIDKNKVKLDYLGDIQEFLDPKSELTEKLELPQEPIIEPEPPSSPRGSLPKDSTEELPQELDLAPEPITEPEEEEATPEQLARLEQLEKQIEKFRIREVKELERLERISLKEKREDYAGLQQRIEKLKEKYHDGKIREIDGVSVEYPKYWFNVRKSNNEPLIRVNMESVDEETLKEKHAELIAFIKTFQ